MRLLITLLITFLLVSGCGYDPEQPVYDTVNNADGYPPAALSLLNSIESGALADYDAIIIGFADLYTEHSEMLDNQSWKAIIDKLGTKFEYMADQAAGEGLAGLTAAATFYQLASFAHPDDNELRRSGSLFSTWLDEAEKDTAGLFDAGLGMSLTRRATLLRIFELGDSIHRDFSHEFLRSRILDGADYSAPIPQTNLAELTQAQIALLNFASLADHEPESHLAEFEEPPVSLITMEVAPQGDGWYQVDLYFKTDAAVPVNYTIAVHLVTEDTLPKPGEGILNYIPFDFDPVTPTSEWPVGKIMAAAKRIYFEGPFENLQVGLYLRTGGAVRMAKIRGSGESMITVAVPIGAESE